MKIVGHSLVKMFLRYCTINAEKLDNAMSLFEHAHSTPLPCFLWKLELNLTVR